MTFRSTSLILIIIIIFLNNKRMSLTTSRHILVEISLVREVKNSSLLQARQEIPNFHNFLYFLIKTWIILSIKILPTLTDNPHTWFNRLSLFLLFKIWFIFFWDLFCIINIHQNIIQIQIMHWNGDLRRVWGIFNMWYEEC